MSASRFSHRVDEGEPTESPLEPACLAGLPAAAEPDDAASMSAEPGSYLKW